ncbi:minor capsid protein [Actinomadura rubrisoli]|uniref:DUF3168 domain-containing protein n=1 Tax=Actinomadura rubrisoli TaxID=2530368 RepID=A0A4R5C1U9_9ACTN|nr:minor capsid protein [Actinomadura rubrisoli]TDD90774.1 hypothetical protein E1298_12800 [Actinomadura rubrisoli]
MGWTRNLLVGLAEKLDERGLARWQPTGAYPLDGLPPIFLRTLGDLPDTALALVAYGDPETEGAGGLADVVQAVQMRTRAPAPDAVDDLADAIWDELHGAEMLRLGTGPAQIATTLIYRRSSAPLGQDEQGRYERTDNYYVTAARPTANRPD